MPHEPKKFLFELHRYKLNSGVQVPNNPKFAPRCQISCQTDTFEKTLNDKRHIKQSTDHYIKLVWGNWMVTSFPIQGASKQPNLWIYRHLPNKNPHWLRNCSELTKNFYRRIQRWSVRLWKRRHFRSMSPPGDRIRTSATSQRRNPINIFVVVWHGEDTCTEHLQETGR